MFKNKFCIFSSIISLVLISTTVVIASTLNINGNVNSSGSVMQGGNILIPSGAIMAFNLSSCPAGWNSFGVSPGLSLIQTGATAYDTIILSTQYTGATKDHTHDYIDYSWSEVGGPWGSTLRRAGANGNGTDYDNGPTNSTSLTTNGIKEINGGGYNYPAGKGVIFCVKN